MATMKDVARLAGVSHGTVSNVLNGAKGVSIDKIRKVEAAIRQLGYKPNALARNLKASKADRSIYVVLPDVRDGACHDIYDGIIRAAESAGYRVNLHLTGEMPYRERQIFSRAQMYNTDGVIVMTCQPENIEYFKKLSRDGMKVVFVMRESGDADFVGIDVKKWIGRSIGAKIASGMRRIALITGPKEYSFESECVDGYLKALFNGNVTIQGEYIRVTASDKESAMRAAIRMLNMQERPEIIYVTSETLAKGVRKAMELTLMPQEEPPELAIIGSPVWTRLDCQNEEDIVLPYASVGESAFRLLLSRIEGKAAIEPGRILMGLDADAAIKNPAVFQRRESSRIRVLLQEGQMGYAVQSLSNDFRKRTGIEVDIDLVNYKNVLERIKSNVNTRQYDVFACDIPWVEELVHGGHIASLEPYLEDKSALFDVFQKNILREYCVYDNTFYALPYSYTVQMLYYRKDLFDKLKNRRMYHDIYKEELRVPRTWAEYNRVARFFTRKYNPDSETLYGTTLGGKVFSGAVCEFLPRAWAFGGNIFNDGRVAINHPKCIEALENYVECFSYANPAAPDWWWDEEVLEFARGDAAMMVVYTDHTTSLRDRSRSNVVGKTGDAQIPGGISVLGGWNIAMSAYSAHKEEAFAFLRWSACEEMAMPNAVLGRVLPYKSICANTELANFYPWHRDSFKAFSHIGKRMIPRMNGRDVTSEKELEIIISEAVYDAVVGRCPAEEAIGAAAARLERLLRRGDE